MSDSHIPIKMTQISYYQKTELYIKNSTGNFVLYKSADCLVDEEKYSQEDHPQLYLAIKDMPDAIIELRNVMNKNLARMIKSGSLADVKMALCEIIQEAVNSNPQVNDLSCFPETIDILYEGYGNASSLLKDLVDIPYGGFSLLQHCSNVLAMVLSYCLFCGLPEEETKKLCLGAMLHDIGCSRIDQRIIGADKKLTDEEYEIYKTHAAIGHDLIKEIGNLDVEIAQGVLEHHERIDGSGYPRGIANLSFAGRLIGLVDSYDNLSCSGKQHRRRLNSFEALMKIRNETFSEGKFDKQIFRDFCLSLGQKTTL